MLEQLLPVFETAPNDARQQRLADLLQTATDELNEELGGIDFFRHPTTGSEAWLVDADGSAILHVHRGIVALDSLEISFDGGREFVTVPADDYALAWDRFSSEEPPEGEPWFHIRMLPGATYQAFPRGTGTVRLTGARGWPAIPSPLAEGVVERARQIAFADPSYEGNVPSQDEFGRPTVTGRWPDVTFKFLRREQRRFYACEL